jgi:hypothetical protein
MIAVLTAVVSLSALGDDENAIILRGGGAAYAEGHATILRLEYEHAVTEFASLVPALTFLDYEYEEEDGDVQTGDGPGVMFGARFYPAREHLHGFYWGVGLGAFDVDWRYEEDDDQYSFIGIAPAFEVGGKIKMGDNVRFDPSLTVGHITTSDTTDEDYEEDEALTTFFVTFNLGISFQF